MSRRAAPALAAAAALSALPAAAGAEGDEGLLGGGYLTLIWENDIFAGEDRKYTNGAYLRYTAPTNALPGWATWLKSGLSGFTPARDWTHGYAAGHALFTSSDINDPDPPLDDRPYAAFLYGSAMLFADAGDRLDVWNLDVGVVGPLALGEEIQSWVHETFTGDDPQGWDTQLENELAFRVLYEQTRRVGLGEGPWGLELDALPRASVALGTLDTSAGGGVMLRAGENLAGDYGPDRLRRALGGPGFGRDGGGWQVFAGAEALAVARNLFLDGNTFRDSRSVDKEPLVAEFTLGAAYAWENVSVSYTHVFRSKEFETQDEWGVFGSVNLRLRF
jgi:hypothetical protein